MKRFLVAPTYQNSLRCLASKSPERKRARLSASGSGIPSNRRREPSFFELIGENAKETGYPLIYVFWLTLKLCSNYFGKRVLEKAYTVDLWHVVWIPASQHDNTFDIVNTAITALCGIFNRFEKRQITSMLKSQEYLVEEFKNIIRSSCEEEMYYYLKSLPDVFPLPAGALKKIAQLSDSSGFLTEGFDGLLLSNPGGWEEADIVKFWKIMGVNKSTLMVFENDPINMRLNNLPMINTNDLYELLRVSKLDVKDQITQFEKDLKQYHSGKAPKDFPSETADHEYIRPPIIDNEQEKLAVHWFEYLRFHALNTHDN